MKNLTVNGLEIVIKFYDVEEKTYTIAVDVNNGESTERFYVSCQHGLTHDYKESSRVTCTNESGGDITDSGLRAYLIEQGIEDYSDEYDAVAEAIEAEAQENVRDLTVEEYLAEEEGEEFKFAHIMSSTLYAGDATIVKYWSDSGKIAVVAEDGDENTIDNIIKKYRVFETKKEYVDWLEDTVKNYEGTIGDDRNLAKMFYDAL